MLPERAAGMLGAARTARRLRDPGWRGEKGQGRRQAKTLLEWAAKELTMSRSSRDLELEFGGIQDWRQREEAERRMGDSLLKWLGLDKPPQQRIKHKVWRKQLVDNTRQLKLGADRARQRGLTWAGVLDGTKVVRAVGAPGAVLEAEDMVGTGADARTRAEAGACMEERMARVTDWDEWDAGDWVAGTGVVNEGTEVGALAEAGPEGAGAGVGAKAEAAAVGVVAGAKAEAAGDEVVAGVWRCGRGWIEVGGAVAWAGAEAGAAVAVAVAGAGHGVEAEATSG